MEKVYFCKDVKRVNEFFKIISEDFKDNVGVKIHFGEDGNTTHIDPKLIKDLGKYFNKPKFIESNVLYKGRRTTKKEHIKLAKEHGFGFLGIDILDGDMGEEEIKVKVGKDVVRLGKGLEKYDNLLVLSHFKGHMLSGFGGAIKNMGMGIGSRAGKLDMHSGIAPFVHEDQCIACGKCVENCPVDTIKINGKAKIYPKKCIGCAKCIAVCPVGAIGIKWRSRSRKNAMANIAKYTAGVVKNKNVWCINFLNNITYNCDCFGGKQEPFMEDIGILMSKDCVAVDKACLDLVKKAKGFDPFKADHDIDGEYVLNVCEKLKIGSKKYKLVEI
ncbi:4Fe-4S ferredoxin [archaeon]|nr:4Fe-4S ferredoxin [archaeon]|tara:strand:+ start:2112 stop:3098 length:987 start_codon:yes stop_codon:yes gene_type:complete